MRKKNSVLINSLLLRKYFKWKNLALSYTYILIGLNQKALRVAVCRSEMIWLSILVLLLSRNMTLTNYLNSWNPTFLI